MLKRIVPYLLTAAILAAPAYAQQEKPKEQPQQRQTSQVTFEAGGEAFWYNARGSRINFNLNTGAGEFSGAYLPLSEDSKNAHDFHVSWLLPKRVTGQTLDVKPVFEHSDAREYGGGLVVTKDAGKFQIAGRGEAFRDGTRYGEIKLLSKHLDLDFGALHDGRTQPYGYFTLNGGRWDDTFTLGYGTDDIVWNNFSFERNGWGIFSANYYQSKTGNWTVEVYSGIGNLNRFWYERPIDRLVANNDINPKERSFVLAFPSYLAFGKWSGEFRADRTGGKRFVNVGAGRTFTIEDGRMKGVRLGLGSGVEHVRNDDEIVWKPNGELFLELPLGSYSVTALKRFRQEEGNWYFSIGRKF